MPSMNTGMRRRTGTVMNTGASPGAGGGYYGYSHAGFGRRRPQPIATATSGPAGFYGLGSGWYGNDNMAKRDMPPSGFYGVADDSDALVEAYLNGHYLSGADETPSVGGEDQLFGDVTTTESFITSQMALGIIGVLGLVHLLRK